jgi:N-acetylglucosaminyl-diphospho-decaprenol L-rhamnosyltransferase
VHPHTSPASPPLELAIVVLNYRTAELTVDCLGSLVGQVGPSRQVFVVDNASGDGSADRIERAIVDNGWSSWARLVRSPRNGGFAAGNNLVLGSVVAQAYLLLNSDTLACPGAIEGLWEAARQRPEAGLIGPGLLDGDGHPDRSFFRAPAPPTELVRSARTALLTRLLSRFDPLLPPTDQPREVDWVGFACVLIRRELLEQIGLLDEGYFMYFEDIDYCRRARRAGWQVLYWPDAKVVHLLGRSSKVTPAEAARRRAPRYYYEARARYFAKFYGRRGLWLANTFWHLGRSIAWAKSAVGRPPRHGRQREALDIWTNALHPLRPTTSEVNP